MVLVFVCCWFLGCVRFLSKYLEPFYIKVVDWCQFKGMLTHRHVNRGLLFVFPLFGLSFFATSYWVVHESETSTSSVCQTPGSLLQKYSGSLGRHAHAHKWVKTCSRGPPIIVCTFWQQLLWVLYMLSNWAISPTLEPCCPLLFLCPRLDRHWRIIQRSPRLMSV